MKKPDEYEILERAHEAAGAHMMQKSPRADELIACLEGEIAKRDEELAACRVAVENCEVFRARIVELEAEVRRWVIRIQQRGLEMDDLSEELKVAHTNISGLDDLVLSLQCKVIERDTELAAIKAQEPVDIEFRQFMTDVVTGAGLLSCGKQSKGLAAELSANAYKYLLGAPVSEAKAQGVVMPEHKTPAPSSKWAAAGEPDPHGKSYDCERAELSMSEYTDDELANAVFMHDHRSFDIAATMRGEPGSIVLLTAAKDRIRWLSRSLDKALARLNAAPEAPAADAVLVEALGYQVLFDAIAAATSVYANGAINISVQAFRAAIAAHRAKGVV